MSSTWLVAVRPTPDEARDRARALLAQARLALGEARAAAIRDVRTETLYELALRGDDRPDEALLARLFGDPVLETTAVTAFDGTLPPARDAAAGGRSVVVRRRPGVMDPPALSARAALRDLGIDAEEVRIARRYLIAGDAVGDEVLDLLVRRVLASDVVDETFVDAKTLPSRAAPGAAGGPVRREVPIRDLDDEALLALSAERTLALDRVEMAAVREHFGGLGREPTDVELETIAQTWSEHCKHKTLRGDVDYVEVDAAGVEVGRELIVDVLKSTIVAATDDVVAGGRDDTVSLFVDNAGIVRFDDDHDICAKVETHNHPSAIEPYGGAGTGVGGVIRDVLGTGQGAWPVCNIDVFCLGPPDLPGAELPRGTLHPRRVLAGVVAGVRDYGNRMGIPTASGALLFDRGFIGNPLVYCGTIGIIPRDRESKAARPGDHIIAAGGRTGRDGIHGATFSSLELTSESESVSSGAVQIGNPIEEKKVADVIEQARDRGLVNGITDCGAGGFSSAIGEMAEEVGATVELERAPLKYPGLTPAEIWISEAQERMVIAAPEGRGAELIALFAEAGVEAIDLGRFGTPDRALVVRWNGEEILRLDPAFLHDGLPRQKRAALWTVPAEPTADATKLPAGDAAADLRAILADLDVASKEWVVRQYDHEVQGLSALRPFVGPLAVGPQDAVAVVPRPETDPPTAALIGLGLCPAYGAIDPFAMAKAAVDEALRNVVAAGGDPARTSILDNFCWGDPNRPEQLAGLVRCARGAAEAARAFGVPFISGKDSLNNTYRTDDGAVVQIPGTLLVTALAVAPDARKLVSMDPKRPGDIVYLVGRTGPHIGATKIAGRRGVTSPLVPDVDLARAPRVLGAVAAAIDAGLVASAHDLAEGGLAVALAECAIASDLGAAIDLPRTAWDGGPLGIEPTDDLRLFAETPTRLLLTVRPQDGPRLEKKLAEAGLTDGEDFAAIGAVQRDPRLLIRGTSGNAVIDEPIAPLRETWRRPLYAVFGEEPPPAHHW